MSNLAVRGPDAASMLGISIRKFRKLEKEGHIRKHSVTGTYPVAMLEEFVTKGKSKNRWPMGIEEESQPGQDSGVRENKRRSRRKSSPKPRGLLESAIDRASATKHAS